MSRKSVLTAFAVAALFTGVALGPVSAADPGTVNGRIAFGTRAADGSANIDSILPNGADFQHVTTGPGRRLCAEYSPDGRSLLFCASTGDAWEIWSVKQNGTKPTQITHLGGFAVFPDLSPDGSRIAFNGFLGEPQNDQVFSVDAVTGGDPVQLTSCPSAHPDCFSSYPVWSPDGRQLLYIHGDGFDADDNPVNEQIWVADANGSGGHPITTGPLPKDQVADWSPDGTKIVFTKGSFGNEGIWTMNADGSGARQLTGCVASDPTPCPTGDDWGSSWSPDGRQIVFLRDMFALGIADRPVMVMNVDGSNVHAVTTAPGIHAVPSWQARGVSLGG
jgi:TolB protein